MKRILNKLKMKLFKKSVVIISLFLITVVIIYFISSSFSIEKATNDVTIKNITITDIKIENNTYTGLLKATKKEKINYVTIKMLDNNNEEIVTLIGYVGKTLEEDETFTIVSSTDKDLSKVSSIEYDY